MKLIALPVVMTLFSLITSTGYSDETDETKQHIESLLKTQDASWNAEDIEGFMQTYWKSDKLTFSGGGNTTRGWRATLDRYKKSYPSGQMGKLHFDQLETTLLSADVALVLGRWYLDIHGEKKEGNFSLVMKKLDQGWKIVHDHSSTLEKEKGWLSEGQATQIAKHILGEEDVTSEKLDHHLVVATKSGNRKVFVDRKTAVVSETKPATAAESSK